MMKRQIAVPGRL